MVSPKKLIKMARKWRLLAATRRNSTALSLTRTESASSSIACKGHFIAYSRDGYRFMVPLAFLSSDIFKELFKLAEEEFGLPGKGPIVLPCDAISMGQVLQVLSMHVSKDVEKAFLNNIIFTARCSTSPFLSQGCTQLHAVLHGF
ncbi:Small auxin-up RNA protein [Dioscorea alata]|uniref:Small auxin-up RNA protein n=1 Tax=Dioscorea alata TaxID=55571 RepID=A0ACB7V6U6_DIOAL|nr:Small auxin-up RNA protein [Dioscorea alata]